MSTPATASRAPSSAATWVPVCELDDISGWPAEELATEIGAGVLFWAVNGAK